MKSRTLAMVGLVSLVSLTAVVVLAFSTRWYLAIFSIIPCLGGLLGVLLLLMASVALRRAKAGQSPRLSWVGMVLLLAGVFLSLQPAYLLIAPTIRDWEVQRAQSFVTSLVPELEEYRRQHNGYPASLESILATDVSLPALLQLSGTLPLVFDNRDFYMRRGTTYGFHFYLPDGFIGFSYEYCCGVDGAWTVTD